MMMYGALRFTLLSALVALSGPAFAQKVGTAGAVKPSVSGIAPGGTTKVMQIGSEIVFNERIRTSAGGAMQILFIDRSTINIGPNSELIIDKFVYDPAKKTGELSATFAKGAMRFVGGQISHTKGVTFSTSNATISVRGGAVGIQEEPNNTTVVCMNGSCSVDPKFGNAPAESLAPGQGFQVSSTGGGKAFSASSGGIQGHTSNTRGNTGKAGGTGGSGTQSSSLKQDANNSQGGTTGGTGGGAGGPGSGGPGDIQVVADDIQDSEPPSPPPGPPPPPPPPPPP